MKDKNEIMHDLDKRDLANSARITFEHFHILVDYIYESLRLAYDEGFKEGQQAGLNGWTD